MFQMTKQWKVLAGWILFFLCSCSRKQPPLEKHFPVKSETVIQQNVPYHVRAVGQLKASLEVAIKSQVNGVLTSILFQDGKKVNENDLLMTIDARPFESDLKAAQAALAEDEAKLRFAKDFAKTYEGLVGQEYVARLDYQQGVQNVDVFEASIEADKALLEKAKVRLGYTEIRAPISGYIGMRTIDPGNYVDATQGFALTTIRKISPITLSFSIPSDYVQLVRQKQQEEVLFVEAFLPEDEETPLVGMVNFINNTVNPQTGMLHMQASIPNVDERGWPGQFVRVRLLVDTFQNALLVPTNAIALSQEGHFVYVIKEDQTVEHRPVKNSFNHKRWTIITEGLNPGEKVVTEGHMNLYPGAKVILHSTDEKEREI